MPRPSSLSRLQGKWSVEYAPLRADGRPPGSILKYAVEAVICTASWQAVGTIEPMLEQGVLEDVPAALLGIKAAAEGDRAAAYSAGLAQSAVESEGQGCGTRDVSLAVAGAQGHAFETFDELRAELTKLYGTELKMPDRTALLATGRCASPAD